MVCSSPVIALQYPLDFLPIKLLFAHDGVKLNSYANLTAVVHAMDAVVSHQAKRNAQKCICVSSQEETALTSFTPWALNEVL